MCHLVVAKVTMIVIVATVVILDLAVIMGTTLTVGHKDRDRGHCGHHGHRFGCGHGKKTPTVVDEPVPRPRNTVNSRTSVVAVVVATGFGCHGHIWVYS